MALRLLQVELAGRNRCVVALEEDRLAVRLDGVTSTYPLADTAFADGVSLEEATRKRVTG